MTNNIDAVAVLRAALTEAAATLRRYEVSHRAKNTDDSHVKAEVNAELAGRFEAIIAATAHVADGREVEHDQGCLQERSQAWFAVVGALNAAFPLGWTFAQTGMDSAVKAIRRLAERAAIQPSPSDLIATHQVPKAKAMAELMQGAAIQPAEEVHDDSTCEGVAKWLDFTAKYLFGAPDLAYVANHLGYELQARAIAIRRLAAPISEATTPIETDAALLKECQRLAAELAVANAMISGGRVAAPAATKQPECNYTWNWS